MKEMSDKEQAALLEAVSKRSAVLETQVQSVVGGYTSAMFVYGPPGLGKSHVLTTMLDGMCGGAWKHHTAYSTAKALMLTLAESPSTIHLFEDCERMLKTDLTASLLRAACGAPDGKPRWVTYETAHERFRVNFTGGLIIATNEDLSRKSGPMQGVASRFRPIKWHMTIPERIAVILKIANSGYSKGKAVLSPGECRKVAKEMIEAIESSDCESTLDLRLFTEHALPTYAHCKVTGTKNWQDVLLSKLEGMATTKEENQGERSQRLQALAHLIDSGAASSKDKVAAWKQRTGLGQAIYYRHLRAARKA